MARATNLRYVSLKLSQAAQEAAAALSSATASLPEAVHRGLEAFRLPLTSVMLITGAAMAPTLNPKAASQPEAVERLLVRLLPRPSSKTVHTGDVVAFRSPLTVAAAAGAGAGGGLGSFAAAALDPELLQNTMIRRVAAMPGDELVAFEGEEHEETFVVPQGHCWVLADNEQLDPPHVIDSRSFGPLPLSNVVGRILYAARSETDHGPVENSTEGMEADAPVIEAELDLEALCGE
ncbi:mitochondrial inner membrane protease subunit 2-like [Chlorella sorokiniana]|uniref:Mitochondrial inner membrane protease subunit 2-like n=1 Tax=Chlorella sorokiniana TaxID=3076 RepID=A0A2P6TB39_CHLSO|nr:mitochondrial inner membrane protease subunit 2-like [Chlorella sorokiniana]|eukprot:PRW05766.1 mitochondrial inner membrane protease subunit 2-like [Chlorella sorokiniana]